MGFPATVVDEMSMWQLTAQVEGYIDGNSPKERRGMSNEEFDAIAKRLDE